MKNFNLFNPRQSISTILLIMSFFIFGASYLPFIGSIFLLFLPLLIFFYSATAGLGKTLGAFFLPLLLSILISYVLQIQALHPLIFTLGIIGLLMSVIALKNSSVEKTVTYPALLLIGAICAYFIYAGWKISVHPWLIVQRFITGAIEQNINLYSQLPLDKESIDLIKNNKQSIASFFTSIFPALAVTGSVIIIWINVLIGRIIIRKAGIYLPKLDNLSHWKAPDFAIWIFLAAGGMLLLPAERFSFTGLNLLIVTCFVYLLQGLAVISFIFQNKNVPIFFRFLIYFLIAVEQFLMIPIIAVGLFDIWVDFRKFFSPDRRAAA